MIIIFEGVDNCGKTTIAQEFCKRHPEFNYFKVKKEQMYVRELSPEDITKMHAIELNFFYELASQVNMNIVFDRFYPSEYAYGKTFRNINGDEILRMDEKFAKLGTKIVMCIKPTEKFEDDLFNKEQLIRVSYNYSEFAEKTKCEILVLETDDEDIGREINEIETFCL